jgi:hypothetical protein
VDEQWVCPKCGFGNEYYAAYCVSCNEPRPIEEVGTGPDAHPAIPNHKVEALPPAASEQLTAFQAEVAALRETAVAGMAASEESSAHECPICNRRPAGLFSFRSNIGMVFTRRVYHFEGRLCRTCAKGKFREFQTRNLAWGWYGLISFASTLTYTFGNLSNYRKNLRGLGEPLPTDPATEKKLAGRPVILGALPGLALLAAIVAVIAVVLTAQAQERADRPYIDDFIRVNSIRSEVVNLANTRTNEWVAQSKDPVPTPAYLCADELEALRDDIERMIAPTSDELLQLHQAWLASVRELAAAERLLTTEPTETNLLADNAAFTAEYAAYQALFDYCKAHE